MRSLQNFPNFSDFEKPFVPLGLVPYMDACCPIGSFENGSANIQRDVHYCSDEYYRSSVDSNISLNIEKYETTDKASSVTDLKIAEGGYSHEDSKLSSATSSLSSSRFAASSPASLMASPFSLSFSPCEKRSIIAHISSPNSSNRFPESESVSESSFEESLENLIQHPLLQSRPLYLTIPWDEKSIDAIVEEFADYTSDDESYEKVEAIFEDSSKKVSSHWHPELRLLPSRLRLQYLLEQNCKTVKDVTCEAFYLQRQEMAASLSPSDCSIQFSKKGGTHEWFLDNASQQTLSDEKADVDVFSVNKICNEQSSHQDQSNSFLWPIDLSVFFKADVNLQLLLGITVFGVPSNWSPQGFLSYIRSFWDLIKQKSDSSLSGSDIFPTCSQATDLPSPPGSSTQQFHLACRDMQAKIRLFEIRVIPVYIQATDHGSFLAVRPYTIFLDNFQRSCPSYTSRDIKLEKMRSTHAESNNNGLHIRASCTLAYLQEVDTELDPAKAMTLIEDWEKALQYPRISHIYNMLLKGVNNWSPPNFMMYLDVLLHQLKVMKYWRRKSASGVLTRQQSQRQDFSSDSCSDPFPLKSCPSPFRNLRKLHTCWNSQEVKNLLEKFMINSDDCHGWTLNKTFSEGITKRNMTLNLKNRIGKKRTCSSGVRKIPTSDIHRVTSSIRTSIPKDLDHLRVDCNSNTTQDSSWDSQISSSRPAGYPVYTTPVRKMSLADRLARIKLNRKNKAKCSSSLVIRPDQPANGGLRFEYSRHRWALDIVFKGVHMKRCFSAKSRGLMDSMQEARASRYDVIRDGGGGHDVQREQKHIVDLYSKLLRMKAIFGDEVDALLEAASLPLSGYEEFMNGTDVTTCIKNAFQAYRAMPSVVSCKPQKGFSKSLSSAYSTLQLKDTSRISADLSKGSVAKCTQLSHSQSASKMDLPQKRSYDDLKFENTDVYSGSTSAGCSDVSTGDKSSSPNCESGDHPLDVPISFDAYPPCVTGQYLVEQDHPSSYASTKSPSKRMKIVMASFRKQE